MPSSCFVNVYLVASSLFPFFFLFHLVLWLKLIFSLFRETLCNSLPDGLVRTGVQSERSQKTQYDVNDSVLFY